MEEENVFLGLGHVSTEQLKESLEARESMLVEAKAHLVNCEELPGASEDEYEAEVSKSLIDGAKEHIARLEKEIGWLEDAIKARADA